MYDLLTVQRAAVSHTATVQQELLGVASLSCVLLAESAISALMSRGHTYHMS